MIILMDCKSLWGDINKRYQCVCFVSRAFCGGEDKIDCGSISEKAITTEMRYAKCKQSKILAQCRIWPFP